MLKKKKLKKTKNFEMKVRTSEYFLVFLCVFFCVNRLDLS